MKRLVGIGITCLLLIGIWILPSMLDSFEVEYDGAPLKLAVLGDIPELQNDKINFESITLEKLSENARDISANFNAVMITPEVFEEASEDKYIAAYKTLEIPIVFFDSAKTHKPFVHENLTYESAYEYLNNGSHTTVYLNNVEANKEDAWYFYLENQRDLDELYTDVFNKVEEL